MGYVFRFETLKRVRKIREDLALQEFSAAQERLRDLEGQKEEKLARRMSSVAASAMAADALATAAFVLGPANGIALLEDEDAEGCLTTDGGCTVATQGFEAYLR